MIEHNRAATAGDHAGMPGNTVAAVEDHDLRCAQRDPHPPPDRSGRDGVLRHPDGDQRRAVHPRVQRQARVEHLGRQGREQHLLGGEVITDGADPVADAAVVLGRLPAFDAVVELVEGVHDRHRRQADAVEPADLAFDAALFV